MRTMKKALSIAMALAIALSMMAGAAFSDAGSIKTLDAVNTLTALGIINGFPDGSFKPEQNVTRAEMAKMIYVLKNAGRDDGAVYFKNSVNAFYDVKGHWAEGYVNYAYTLGIIAGKGNGRFDPDSSVTGLEAAKMLLVTLGYNANTEGLVGTQWAIRTASLAQTSSLFDKYAVGLGEGAPRQYAAQMIVNALDAAIVEYEEGVARKQYDLNGKAITLGSRTVNTKTVEDVLVANDNYSYNANSGTAKDKILLAAAGQFTFDASDELVGQKVKVIYKDDNGSGGLNAGDTIVGLAALSSNSLVTFKKGDIDTESATEIKMKTSGTKYKIAGTVHMVLNNQGSNAAAAAYAANLKSNSADTITLIDNNGDGYYDVVKVVEKVFTQVSAVGSESISLLDGGIIKLEDNTVYAGAAKNDFVFVTKNYADAAENNIVEKAEITTAKLEGRNAAGDLLINGSYVAVDHDAIGAQVKSKVDFFWDGAAVNPAPAIDKELDIFMYGKYWVAAKGVSTAADKYAVLTAVDVGIIGPKGKVLFADGSTGTYTLQEGKIWNASGVGAAPVAPATNYTGLVYKYTLNSNNEIKLTQIGTTATLTYDQTQKVVTGLATTRVFTDESTIFVKNTTNNTWKAYTYAEIKDTAIPGAAAAEYVVKDSVLKLATFHVAGGINAAGSGLAYGFLTEQPSVAKSGDDYIVKYTIWNGTESLVRYLNAGTTEPTPADFTANAAKGDFVSFKSKGEDTIVETGGTDAILPALATPANLTDARILDVIGSTVGVGTAADSSTATAFYRVTSDTKIIFVNSKKDASIEKGDILLYDLTLGNGVYNAKFKVKTGNELEVLYIDINSNINE